MNLKNLWGFREKNRNNTNNIMFSVYEFDHTVSKLDFDKSVIYNFNYKL